MRLLICAGGTGGGVYPALAVLEALANQPVEVLWVGSETGMEKDLVQRQNIPFKSIPAAGIHGVGLTNLPGNLAQLIRGVRASNRILKEFNPDVLFFTGGYVAAPMALAGRKYPSVLFVPDIEPGLALKFIARFASFITLSASPSKEFFSQKNKLVVSGYPVRSELSGWKKKNGNSAFGLDPKLSTVLILGGSKGARSINRSILTNLKKILEKWQVIHLSGTLDWQEVENGKMELPAKLRTRYHPFPYLHEKMGAALSCADLVVSRSGASILGEYPTFALPAILIPYPFAWRYQKVNADYLVSKKAAIQLKDEDLDEKLLPAIQNLMDSPTQREKMGEAMKTLAKPDASKLIAKLLQDAAKTQGAKI